MEYMTIKEASVKWGISVRRIQVLCSTRRIDGAERFGRVWAIPVSAESQMTPEFIRENILGKEVKATILKLLDLGWLIE